MRISSALFHFLTVLLLILSFDRQTDAFIHIIRPKHPKSQILPSHSFFLGRSNHSLRRNLAASERGHIDQTSKYTADLEGKNKELADIAIKIRSELKKTKEHIKKLTEQTILNDQILREHLKFKEDELKYLNEKLEINARKYESSLIEKEKYIQELEQHVENLESERNSLRRLIARLAQLFKRRIAGKFANCKDEKS